MMDFLRVSWVCLGLAMTAGAEVTAIGDYAEPNFFRPEGLAESDLKFLAGESGLVDALVQFSRIGSVPSQWKARALGLALNIDPTHPEALTLNHYYRLGQKPDFPTDFFTPSQLMSTMERATQRLLNINPRSQVASMLHSITSEIPVEFGAGTSNDPFSLSRSTASVLPVDWNIIDGKGGTVSISSVERRGPIPRTTVEPEPSQPVPSEPMEPGERWDPLKDLEIRQSKLHGLLVMELEGSQVAGEASLLNATALRGASGRPFQVTFNQSVGDMMSAAMREVLKFLTLRHDRLPDGIVTEISFEEQYSMKDGPSAAVACGLLTESILSGTHLDPNFAVTGDMNADGMIQPVGGIDGKVRGAINRDCTHLGVPIQNLDLLHDIFVLDGVQPFIDIQIFSLENFEEALALASDQEVRDDQVQESIQLYGTIQKVLEGKSNPEAMLDNVAVVERLRKIVELTPNHVSAKVLLMAGIGKEPEQLSLGGSLVAIDRAALPLLQALSSGQIASREEEITDAVFALRRVRSKLDPRTRGCLDAIEDFSDALRQSLRVSSAAQRAEANNRLRNASSRVQSEYDKLRSDPAIQEKFL